jgi:hypothetical protein
LWFFSIREKGKKMNFNDFADINTEYTEDFDSIDQKIDEGLNEMLTTEQPLENFYYENLSFEADGVAPNYFTRVLYNETPIFIIENNKVKWFDRNAELFFSKLFPLEDENEAVILELQKRHVGWAEESGEKAVTAQNQNLLNLVEAALAQKAEAMPNFKSRTTGQKRQYTSRDQKRYMQAILPISKGLGIQISGDYLTLVKTYSFPGDPEILDAKPFSLVELKEKEWGDASKNNTLAYKSKDSSYWKWGTDALRLLERFSQEPEVAKKKFKPLINLFYFGIKDTPKIFN